MTEEVAEAASGDHRAAVGEGVAADDELKRTLTRIQVVLEVRRGDVDDEEVELRL